MSDPTGSACYSCGYSLKGLAVVDGRASCPECGTSQDIAGYCGECRCSLAGVAAVDGCVTCSKCEFKNQSQELLQRRSDAEFVRRRRWLMWSPAIALPGYGLLIWLGSDGFRFVSAWMPAMAILVLLWCFVTPVVYVIGAGLARAAGGRPAWPVVEVGAMWFVTSLLTTMALFVVALTMSSLGFLT